MNKSIWEYFGQGIGVCLFAILLFSFNTCKTEFALRETGTENFVYLPYWNLMVLVVLCIIAYLILGTINNHRYLFGALLSSMLIISAPLVIFLVFAGINYFYNLELTYFFKTGCLE